MIQPKINVTPLIDVLLVLLIIFMVINPARLSRFEAKVPSEPDRSRPSEPNPDTLQVRLESDSGLSINSTRGFGNVDETAKLTEKLSAVFSERQRAMDLNVPGSERVERTVFIKAPRSAAYGNVARVVDAVKASGASPISLLVDGLD